MHKSHVINLRKLIFIPISFIFVFSVVFGLITLNQQEKAFNRESDSARLIITQTIRDTIHQAHESRIQLIETVDEKNLMTAQLVIQERTQISNDYLYDLLEIMNVDNIWFYSPEGVVLYDANETYIGWTAQPNDPIYSFMMSGLDVYIEDIRVSTEDDSQHKNVYLRDNDGYFVQVSTSLDTIEDYLYEFENQVIIDELIANYNDLLYILIINEDYVAIADTDPDDILVDYSGDPYYERSFLGEITSSSWFYEKINQEVVEVTAPIYHDDEVIQVIGVGFSLENYHLIIQGSIISTVLTSLIYSFGLIVLLMILVYSPMVQLDYFLTRHDAHALLPIHKSSAFTGLFQHINTYIETINSQNQKMLEDYLLKQYLGTHDEVTQLLNNHGLSQLQIDKHSTYVLFLCNLENYHYYLETKGVVVANSILIQIADRLKSLENSDTIISKFGEASFIVFSKYKTQEDFDELQRRIMDLSSTDLWVEGMGTTYMSFLIGAATYPHDGIEIADLTNKAAIAIHLAKNYHHVNYVRYSVEAQTALNKDIEVFEMLKNAIDQDGFEMVYQPQIDFRFERVVSFEALLRIKGSSLSPAIFIPVAERHGLMNQIGRMVSLLVIKQIRSWMDHGYKPLPVFINVSPNQLYDSTFEQDFIKMIAEYQIPFHLLGIEITEETLIEHKTLLTSFLKKMRSLGLRTAIDDFGHGQAGVNYLTSFEIDVVKLSKVLADKYLNSQNSDVYHAIIRLCKSLGFQVLAEGIETKDQIDLLKNHPVCYIQGYYYYKPMDVLKITSLLDISDTTIMKAQ